MFKQLLFLCSFILFQATLSQAQVIDFFNAASITIWGDDFDISRINSHSQEDRTYNGKKNGVDKLDINFYKLCQSLRSM